MGKDYALSVYSAGIPRLLFGDRNSEKGDVTGGQTYAVFSAQN